MRRRPNPEPCPLPWDAAPAPKKEGIVTEALKFIVACLIAIGLGFWVGVHGVLGAVMAFCLFAPFGVGFIILRLLWKASTRLGKR